MKLSEAIRNGCEGTYQIFGSSKDGKGGFCALGAAGQYCLKIDGGMTGSFYQRVRNLLTMPVTVCPVCQATSMKSNSFGIKYTQIFVGIGGVIMHLNDDHKMSREAIAEFVEAEERKLGLWDEKKEEAKAEVVSTEVVNGDCVLSGSKS